MQVGLIALSTALLLTGPQRGPVEKASVKSYPIRNCLITLIQDVNVSAEEPGQLKEWKTPVLDQNGAELRQQGEPVYQEVREGLQVFEGQMLGRIDDRMEEKLKNVAQYKLDVAKMEVINDVSVRYARKAKDVAEADVQQAIEANRKVRNTIPPAEFRRRVLARDQAELQIEQSEHDLKIADKSVAVRQAELEVAEMQLARRRITAPFDGVIQERYVEVGEWVKPGDPVLRIIRINRLRIKASVAAAEVLPAEVKDQEVLVKLTADSGIAMPAGAHEQVIRGRIFFASDLVNVDGTFDVWADVDNVRVAGDWLLRPGMTAQMTINLKPIDKAGQMASARTR